MYLQHEQACLILEERFRESGEGVVSQGPFGGGVERAAQAERTRHVTSPTPRCTDGCSFAAAHIIYGVIAAAGDDPSNILTRARRRQRLLFIRYPQPKQLIGTYSSRMLSETPPRRKEIFHGKISKHPDAFLVQGGNVTRTLRTLLRTIDTKQKTSQGQTTLVGQTKPTGVRRVIGSCHLASNDLEHLS